MSDKIISFAKTLTVGVKGYKDLSVEDPQLSFMTPNTEDASYAKRLATLKGWCLLSRTYDYATKTYTEVAQNSDNIHNLENVPTTGFRIMNATSRYSTDNKFFRLIDPRGYILEISTGNLEVILQTSDILKGGYIAEPCVWGRQGNNNILVAVSSEAYAKSVKFAEQKTTSFKDLIIGDIVKFKDGTESIYLGEYAAIVSKQARLNPDRVSSVWATRAPREAAIHSHSLLKGEKYHAFKTNSDTSSWIDLVKKLKPCAVIGKTTEKIEDIYSKSNKAHIRMPTNDYSKSVRCIIQKDIEINDIKYSLDLTEIEYNDVEMKNKFSYMVVNDSGMLIQTYASRFHYGELTDSYSEILYDPMSIDQFKTMERNLNRELPIKFNNVTFVTGIKIVVNTSSGQYELNGNS